MIKEIEKNFMIINAKVQKTITQTIEKIFSNFLKDI
jgi:hypothetical protein